MPSDDNVIDLRDHRRSHNVDPVEQDVYDDISDAIIYGLENGLTPAQIAGLLAYAKMRFMRQSDEW
jgi:hypothetical protein